MEFTSNLALFMHVLIIIFGVTILMVVAAYLITLLWEKYDSVKNAPKDSDIVYHAFVLQGELDKILITVKAERSDNLSDIVNLLSCAEVYKYARIVHTMPNVSGELLATLKHIIEVQKGILVHQVGIATVEGEKGLISE